MFEGKERRVFSRTNAEPPQYIGKDAQIKDSIITEGCEINGTVENSVLSEGVIVEEGATVRDSVIMNGVTIKKNAKVEYTIIDSGVVIGSGASIGADKENAKGITVIGSGIAIDDGKVIADGEMVNDAYYEEKLKGDKTV